jgi:heme/copper-type cytochrome/quinol oxidase subunit 4
MNQLISLLLSSGLLFISFDLVVSTRFSNHERVPIVANTVGPFNNPTETYPVS